MNDFDALRPLGSTGRTISPLCVGTSGWGDVRPNEDESGHVRRVSDLADRVLAGEWPVNYIDTSNIYGRGQSEALIGDALRRAGGIPEGFVVQTKLDRDLSNHDFTGAQMRRSLEQSLERLGVSRVQVLFLHDPEAIGFEASMAEGGPVEALVAMKESGLADAIGISGGPVPMLQQFVDTNLFDILITHNRYTLVDRSAHDLLASAKALSMAVNNAAPYGGGALSGRPGTADRYGYRPAHPQVRTAIERMSQLCADAGVPLSAAALQFSLRDPLVDSTVVGTSSVDRLEAALADAAIAIPHDLWAELDSLAPDASAALDAR